MRFPFTFRPRPRLAPLWRAMLCGIGIYYAGALLLAEELARRGWHDPGHLSFYLERSARAFPFDHRFREYGSIAATVKVQDGRALQRE